MKQGFRKILIWVPAVIFLWASAITVSASQFEVTNDNVRIRAEASTASDSVGSANRGDTFAIEGEATDADNNLWYRVRFTGDTYGYIRHDLGRATGTATSGASGDAEPVPHREATVNQTGVRVRSGPSTTHGEVANLQRGSAVIITGEGKDSAGRVWYQIKATVDNREIIGFVRSDLITAGELIDMGEGSIDDDYLDDYYGDDEIMTPEDQGSSDSPIEQHNFEIRYVQNDVGGYDYYLYDRSQGTQWKVEDLLALSGVAVANELFYNERLDRQKMIIIILAVVIIILALILTVLIFKIRDLSEDAEMDLHSFRPNSDAGLRTRGDAVKKPGTRPPDGRSGGNRPLKRSPERSLENDDANVVDRSETPGRRAHGSQGNQGNARPRRSADGELQATGREGRGPRPERKEAKGPMEAKAVDDAPKRPEPTKNMKQNSMTRTPQSAKATGERPEVKPEAKPAPARKPQNFLTDDDEFDFEFLNIDE